MGEVADIDIQLHRLSAKLWVNENYDYYIKVNKLRAKINHRKNAVPKLEAKIIQYVKDLESYMLELKSIERGHKPKDKTEWSNNCIQSHHKKCINCECWCHNA
jgi:hypothetical protein